MSQKGTRFLLFIGATLYYFGFTWAYRDVVSPLYSYMGLIVNEISSGINLLLYPIAIIPIYWVPVELTRPSQVVYWFLYLIVYVPSIIVPYYTLKVDPFSLVLFSFTLFFSLWIFKKIYKLPLIVFPNSFKSKFLFWFLIISVCSIFYAYIISVFGLNFKLVSLNEVYDVRAQYKESLLDKGVLVAYAIGWVANVFNILFLSYGLVTKRYGVMLVGFLGQLSLYSITGFKSVFFSGVLIIALLITLRKKGKFFSVNLVWGSVILIILSIITLRFFDSISLTSLYLHRNLALPGLLTGFHFEFFSANPKTYLSYSIFKYFLNNPYGIEPARLIGKVYFNSPVMSANANIWADAFDNFGYAGVVFFTMLLAVLMWIYDSLAKNIDYRLSTLLLATPAFTLCNVGLLTSILTHGLGLTILVLYLMPRGELDTIKIVGFTGSHLNSVKGVITNKKQVLKRKIYFEKN